MRFLADMGISPKSVSHLRSQGHDAVHIHELGLERLDDEAILKLARDEGRVLLTHDLDFGELMAASGDSLPSVVVFRLRNMRPERVSQYLDQIVEKHSEALEEGVIASVTEGQIRMRPLPIRHGE
jgi:predicted nuclease of predicted toxin-antitoxin system